MATNTVGKQIVDLKWSEYYQIFQIDVGWYDIILQNGDRYNEVYYEHDYFHFPNSVPSIHREKVQWIRKHK